MQILTTNGNIEVNRLELSQPTAPIQIILKSNDLDHLLKISKDIFSKVEKLDKYGSGELVAPEYKTDVVLKLNDEKIVTSEKRLKQIVNVIIFKKLQKKEQRRKKKEFTNNNKVIPCFFYTKNYYLI